MTQRVLQTYQSVLHFSSPRAERSARIENFREDANAYLADLDTRLAEFSYSLLALIVAYQVLVLHDQSTPFLSSALRILKLPLDSWAVMLGVIGCAQFFGFLRSAKEQKSMRARAAICGLAALVWFFTIIAIATTVPFVFAAILRYVLAFVVNGIMYLSLNARHRDAILRDKANNAAGTDS